MRLLSALLVMTSFAGCSRTAPSVVPRAEPVSTGAAPPSALLPDSIEDILRSDRELAASVAQAERLRLQVLLAVPDGAGGLARTGFRVDDDYFYPASSVKLGTAVGALDKLGDLRAEHGESVSTQTGVRFVTGSGRTRRVLNTTVRRDLEQSLVVSSNEAFNRLLDFVGPEELAERLARRGIASARIAHHLGDVSTWSLPTIELLLPGRASAPIGQRIGFPIPSAPDAKLGSAYRNERGRLVRQPMDFSAKNAIPLRELQDLLIGVVRPDLTDKPAVWELPFRSVLVDTLGLLPSELDGVRGPRAAVLDARFKPLAVAINDALPDQAIRVYGKGGRAYGFAVENAYVTSEKSRRSFFVTTTIYANGNDTMNDDRYEYDAVANPFVARLGVVLAQHLLVPPDTQED